MFQSVQGLPCIAVVDVFILFFPLFFPRFFPMGKNSEKKHNFCVGKLFNYRLKQPETARFWWVLIKSRNIIDNKYPYSDGGWIHYRVINQEHYEDTLNLLKTKCQ
ncbi:MAG: hypothetical protein ACI4WG_00990 [Erysipelotrichaceae bacterium]